jgi:hypothetical protein
VWRTWRCCRLHRLPWPVVHQRSARLLEVFGLGEPRKRPVQTYSGGMRRELDLALSLISEPPVLFLDEPTTGLDTASRQALWDIIRGLVRQGTTVLLTTQYLDEADALAGSVVFIDAGQVAATGTPAELKARAGQLQLDLVAAASADPGRLTAALGAFQVATEGPRQAVRVAVGGSGHPGGPRGARHHRGGRPGLRADRAARVAPARPRRRVLPAHWPRPSRPGGGGGMTAVAWAVSDHWEMRITIFRYWWPRRLRGR